MSVLSCICDKVSITTDGTRGTTFHLSEDGDVTWKLTENAMPAPLFKCNFFDIDRVNDREFVLKFGVYRARVLRCPTRISKENVDVISIFDGWCKLTCKKLGECNETVDVSELQFSFLPALQDSYFSDLKLKASNNKEFDVHSLILNLCAPDIDWSSENLFSNLSEEVLFAILHFSYAQCLPAGLNEKSTKNIIFAASNFPKLQNLVYLCNVHLNHLATKEKIFALMTDIHGCVSRLMVYFSKKYPGFTTTLTEPDRLFLAFKNSLRELAVAASKFLLICDLCFKGECDFSNEERHEIFVHIQSRIPILLYQVEHFLSVFRDAICELSSCNIKELASYLASKFLTICYVVFTLLRHARLTLFGILRFTRREVEVLSKKSPQNVEDVVDKVFLEDEIFKIQEAICGVIKSQMLLNDIIESFHILARAEVIEQLHELFEDLLDTLPRIVKFFKKSIPLLIRTWQMNKFNFKVFFFSLYFKLEKIRKHKDCIQDALKDLVRLVNRDTFSKSLIALRLLSKSKEKKSEFTLKHPVWVPPPANFNRLSRAALKLFKSEIGTDLTFEIIMPEETNAAVNQAEAESVDVNKHRVEKYEMKAHRVIVAARCDWFKRVLLSGMQEDINRKILIHDTSPHIFSRFLKYLYTGRMEFSLLSMNDISEMLRLCDRYEMDSLKEICEHELKLYIDKYFVLYLYSLADDFNAKILRGACEKYIALHPEIEDKPVKKFPKNLTSKFKNFFMKNELKFSSDLSSKHSKKGSGVKALLKEFLLSRNKTSELEKLLWRLDKACRETPPDLEEILVLVASKSEAKRILKQLKAYK